MQQGDRCTTGGEKRRIQGTGNSKAVLILKFQRIISLDGRANGNWTGMVKTLVCEEHLLVLYLFM